MSSTQSKSEERSVLQLLERLNLFERGVKRLLFETYLKLEPLVDLKMLLVLEDETGCRQVGGSQRFVDDFFGSEGIRSRQGDLEITLDARKRNMVEMRRDAAGQKTRVKRKLEDSTDQVSPSKKVFHKEEEAPRTTMTAVSATSESSSSPLPSAASPAVCVKIEPGLQAEVAGEALHKTALSTQVDMTKNDVTKNDVTKNDVAKNDVTKKDVKKNDVAKNDVSKNDVTPSSVMETSASAPTRDRRDRVNNNGKKRNNDYNSNSTNNDNSSNISHTIVKDTHSVPPPVSVKKESDISPADATTDAAAAASAVSAAVALPPARDVTATSQPTNDRSSSKSRDRSEDRRSATSSTSSRGYGGSRNASSSTSKSTSSKRKSSTWSSTPEEDAIKCRLKIFGSDSELTEKHVRAVLAEYGQIMRVEIDDVSEGQVEVMISFFRFSALLSAYVSKSEVRLALREKAASSAAAATSDAHDSAAAGAPTTGGGLIFKLCYEEISNMILLRNVRGGREALKDLFTVKPCPEVQMIPRRKCEKDESDSSVDENQEEDALLIFDEAPDNASDIFDWTYRKLRQEVERDEGGRSGEKDGRKPGCSSMIFAREEDLDDIAAADLLVRYRRPIPNCGWTVYVSQLDPSCDVNFRSIRTLFGDCDRIVHVNFRQTPNSRFKMADIQFESFSGAHLAVDRYDNSLLWGNEIRVHLHRKENSRLDRWVCLQRRCYDHSIDGKSEDGEEEEAEEDFDEEVLKAQFQAMGNVQHVFITWEENMALIGFETESEAMKAVAAVETSLRPDDTDDDDEEVRAKPVWDHVGFAEAEEKLEFKNYLIGTGKWTGKEVDQLFNKRHDKSGPTNSSSSSRNNQKNATNCNDSRGSTPSGGRGNTPDFRPNASAGTSRNETRSSKSPGNSYRKRPPLLMRPFQSPPPPLPPPTGNAESGFTTRYSPRHKL